MNAARLAYYRSLARAGNANAQRVVDAFDPDQPREADGKWGGAGSQGHHEAEMQAHEKEYIRLNTLNQRVPRLAENEKESAHRDAMMAHAAAGAAILRGDPKEHVRVLAEKAEAASSRAYGGAENRDMHRSLRRMGVGE